MLTNELETFYCATEYRTKKLLLLNRKLYRSSFFLSQRVKITCISLFPSLSSVHAATHRFAQYRAAPRRTPPRGAKEHSEGGV